MNFDNRPRDPDVSEPYEQGNDKIILVVTSSPIYNKSLKAYLLDMGYSVAGPFKTVDRGYTFYRKQVPNLIIFDSISDNEELDAFKQFLLQEPISIPLLIINQNGINLDYTNYETISPPLKPSILENKLDNLLFDENDNRNNSNETKILNFTNNLFQKIIELVPDEFKPEVESEVNRVIAQFSMRNSDFARVSEESIKLRINNDVSINPNEFRMQLRYSVEDLISEINKKQDTKWARSLVEDAIEAIIIDMKDLPQPIKEFVTEMGMDYEFILNSFASAVPEMEELNKKVVVAKILLSDLGPELVNIVSDDQNLINDFDPGVASQLITLVGQGASYHEGIFGPIPLPSSNDIVVIISSRLMKSQIKDKRMGGKTLVVIAIGIRSEVINLIPERHKLNNVFSPLNELKHEREITDDILQHIEKNFENYLNTSDYS